VKFGGQQGILPGHGGLDGGFLAVHMDARAHADC